MGIADPDHVAELFLCQSAGLSQLAQQLLSLPPHNRPCPTHQKNELLLLSEEQFYRI
jgi:hypothetical protein